MGLGEYNMTKTGNSRKPEAQSSGAVQKGI